MTEKASGAVLGDRAVTTCNFLDALRHVQSGRQVRRAGWDPSLLYVARNPKLNRIDLVRESRDGAGTYRFAEPYLGGAALGGPAIVDYLATDWQLVQDSRAPTADGGERAQAAQLAEIADTEKGQSTRSSV